MKRICLLTLGLTLTLALTGCGTAPTEPSQATQPTPSPTPEIIRPSEPVNTESAPPAPVESAPALPPEPTAAMFRFEGLDAALFDGAYRAYFDQEWISSFADFPRIVLPHINVLGTYEDGRITYYVCDIMYKLHYYDEETKRFDDNTGSLATHCRIGLVDNGDGTYTVESGLLPPSGGQYGSVMKEVFGPLDELYQAYTAEDGVGLDAVRSFPSSEELWEMYREAANIQ